MLYQLSYAHHRLIANSLTLFLYAASVCMFAIEGSVAMIFAWNSGRACVYRATIWSEPCPIQRRITGSNQGQSSIVREETFASAVDVGYGCGNPNNNHD